MSRQKVRCRDCSHVQMCRIWPQFKWAWDKTFNHLEEGQGEDSFLAQMHELLARYCRHFEKAAKGQKVLPINPKDRPQ